MCGCESFWFKTSFLLWEAKPRRKAVAPSFSIVASLSFAVDEETVRMRICEPWCSAGKLRVRCDESWCSNRHTFASKLRENRAQFGVGLLAPGPGSSRRQLWNLSETLPTLPTCSCRQSEFAGLVDPHSQAPCTYEPPMCNPDRRGECGASRRPRTCQAPVRHHGSVLPSFPPTTGRRLGRSQWALQSPAI